MRERLDVALRVAALHPERVQLHQLARVVLVQAAGAIPRVVEVDEHRGMARGGAEEIAEAAERVRPDGALLVVGDQRAQRPLELEDVEVVEPEPGEVLLELVRRIERAQEHAGLRLARKALQLFVQRLALGLPLLRRRALQRAAAALELRAELGERALRDGHGVDAPLELRRQGRARRMELRVEPATAAEARDLRGGRAARAPGDSVQYLELH